MRTIPLIGPILSALKAIIIALIFATVLFVLIKIFSGRKSENKQVFLSLFVVCIIGWTIFINSYWADTGYYDNFRIPLGNDKEIVSAFGQGSAEIKSVYFQQQFTTFALTDTVVYGMLETEKDTTYIIYNIPKNALLSFANLHDYLNNAEYPKPLSTDMFKSPEKNYYDYWGKFLWLY